MHFFLQVNSPIAGQPNQLDSGNTLAANGQDLDNYLAICGVFLPGVHDVSTIPDEPPADAECYDNPTGGSSWNLSAMQVPNCSSDGLGSDAQNTFAYWLKIPVIPVEYDVCAFPFGGICYSDPSSSGMNAAARELAKAQCLHVIIPNGANHGTYVATLAASMKWNVIVRGINYVLTATETSANCTIRGPQRSVTSTSIASNPFVAIFPGEFFGATNDIVVTLG